MSFPHDVSPELRRWINARGTRVMKTWLELHDRSKPKGLRERLDRKTYEERLKREGAVGVGGARRDHRRRGRVRGMNSTVRSSMSGP